MRKFHPRPINHFQLRSQIQLIRQNEVSKLGLSTRLINHLDVAESGSLLVFRHSNRTALIRTRITEFVGNRVILYNFNRPKLWIKYKSSTLYKVPRATSLKKRAIITLVTCAIFDIVQEVCDGNRRFSFKQIDINFFSVLITKRNISTEPPLKTPLAALPNYRFVHLRSDRDHLAPRL